MSNSSKNAPSHTLFVVTGDGEKKDWTEIGAAWPTKDGKGFSLQLKSAPLDGRIVMRLRTKKEGA